MLKEILIQAGYYFAAMSIGVFLISIIQRGIFWPLIRARASFGKLCIVKLRQVHRDYLRLGYVEDGFLVWGKKAKQRRVSLPSNEFFYRISGLIFIDVNDEKNSLCKPDYSTSTGFDAVKINNLFIRTLFKPSVSDNQDRIIIICLILIIIACGVLGFLIYKNGYSLQFLTQQIGKLAEAGKGVVTRG